jgi:hypothetical protein
LTKQGLIVDPTLLGLIRSNLGKAETARMPAAGQKMGMVRRGCQNL